MNWTYSVHLPGEKGVEKPIAVLRVQSHSISHSQVVRCHPLCLLHRSIQPQYLGSSGNVCDLGHFHLKVPGSSNRDQHKKITARGKRNSRFCRKKTEKCFTPDLHWSVNAPRNSSRSFEKLKNLWSQFPVRLWAPNIKRFFFLFNQNDP